MCTLTALLASTSGSSADDSFQQQLLDRIEALEKQGQDQSSIMQLQAESLKRMESKLEGQAERLVSQEETIREYKDRVKQLEITVDEMKSRNDQHAHVTPGRHDNNVTVGEKQSRTDAVNKKLSAQRRVLLNAEAPVAFHAVIATLADISHIGLGQRIVFPDVFLNLGAGYQNSHGIFTAPQPGLYIFSTSIMSHDTGHPEIWVHLMKNGNVMANAYAHGTSGRHDQGSVTVVAQLAVGDEVWVSLMGPADTTLWGERFDTFMGCLIVPL